MALQYSGQCEKIMHYQVAIVGYGPAGATLANMLGQRGVSCVVLEREHDIYSLPRAVHFDDEVMRVFQGIGIADDLAKVTRFNPGMRFVDADGNLMLDWPRPTETGPQAWLSSYRFHQPHLERLLREHAGKYDNVTVHTDCEVVDIDDSTVPVVLKTKNRATGDTSQVTADWVVGCDGARSMVREKIGTGMDDLGFREHWLVIDIFVNDSWKDLGKYTLQFCVPERPATYVCGPHNRRRWEIALQPNDDLETIATDEAVWELLSPWVSRDQAELERRALYEFHSVNALQWRKGRLFVAGDAAHQMPPFMGQGMCSGMRDVANLAWKLDAVIKGEASEKLLDTYTTERAPHVREYIATAIRLGGLINTSKTKEALETAFPKPDGSAEMKSITPAMGSGLGARGEDWLGRPGPQFFLEDGRRSDDVTGHGAVLIATPDVLGNADTKGLATLPENTFGVQDYLDSIDAVAVLLRPDRYVFDIAKTVAEIPDLVASWRDALDS